MLCSLLAIATVTFRSAIEPPVVWGSNGHMAVAEVAWATLGKDAAGRAIQDKIEKILADHPFQNDIHWTGSHANEDLRYSFALAATWPDQIKVKPHSNAPYHAFYSEFAQPFGRPPGEDVSKFEASLHPWHFFDVRIHETANGAGLKADKIPSTIDLAQKPADIANAYQALEWTRSILKDTSADPKMRAIALCWIEHLVGDLHQPLHCATFVSAEHADGDHGGNLFHVPKPDSGQNLHSFWDDILHPKAHQDISTLTAHLLTDIQLQPTKAPETGEGDLDPAHWIQRGANIAASSAYWFDGKALRDALDGASSMTAEMKKYRAQVLAVADERALLGGMRLAAMLKTDL